MKYIIFVFDYSFCVLTIRKLIVDDASFPRNEIIMRMLSLFLSVKTIFSIKYASFITLIKILNYFSINLLYLFINLCMNDAIDEIKKKFIHCL